MPIREEQKKKRNREVISLANAIFYYREELIATVKALINIKVNTNVHFQIDYGINFYFLGNFYANTDLFLLDIGIVSCGKDVR